ncbi:MAG: hypothetical protein QXJ14_03570 [Candidatus Aenigmatarchaeota archaeon]
MEIGDILVWLFLMATIAALLLIVSGEFFKLRVEIVSSKQFFSTYSILNSYLSTGNFLIDRLLIDKNFFDNWDENKIDKIETYDFNYIVNFSNKYIKNFESNSNNFQFSDNNCYTNFGMMKKSIFNSFSAVCEKEFYCEPIKIEIISTITPLSQLAYWLSYSCLSKESFEKRISILTKDFSSININSGKVCIDNKCQNFEECGFSKEIKSHEAKNECAEIIIKFSYDERKILIDLPKK